jgi:hypothetical protein
VGRRAWRWAVVADGVAVLLLLPSVVAALPARTTTVSAQDLLSRVRASAQVGWSGYGESSGTLVLPDVRELDDLPALLGGTTRARAWWRGPDSWRVDALSLLGETDTVRDPGGTWTWQSEQRRAVRVLGRSDVRLPTAADLLPPTLGRRLAAAPDVVASRLPARRVAGRSADGLRLVPQERSGTTVAAVQMWVEPRTGLPLQVEVHTAGEPEPALGALLLDLELERPHAARTSFVPPPEAAATVVEVPDLAAASDRYAPYRLPDELAGLTRQDAGEGSSGGVGTYGQGLHAVAVVPLPSDVARRALRRIDADGDGLTAVVETPLLSVVVARAGGRRAYLLAGAVPLERLTAVLEELRSDPPPRIRW